MVRHASSTVQADDRIYAVQYPPWLHICQRVGTTKSSETCRICGAFVWEQVEPLPLLLPLIILAPIPQTVGRQLSASVGWNARKQVGRLPHYWMFRTIMPIGAHAHKSQNTYPECLCTHTQPSFCCQRLTAALFKLMSLFWVWWPVGWKAKKQVWSSFHYQRSTASV